MLDFRAIWTVARFETKLLFRSWAFRIFSLMGLTILVFMNIGVGTAVGRSPHMLISLSGSLPLANIKLLNIYQGIIAIFLTTEFMKRDHRHDSTQIIFARSFSNLDYMLGKITGIIFLFAILDAIVLAQTFVIHRFFSESPFAFEPYIISMVFVSLPTLIFIIGMSLFLVSLIRNQAVVFVVMLGYSLLVLILLGQHWFYVFDCYALFIPLIYSDIAGLGNLNDLLLNRGLYFLSGIGLIALSVVMVSRLRQSKISFGISLVVAVLSITTAIGMGYKYLTNGFETREYRVQLKNQSQTLVDYSTATLSKCTLDLQHSGNKITVEANLKLTNDNQSRLDSLLLTLNPSLIVDRITSNNTDLVFRQDNHLIWVQIPDGLVPEQSIDLKLEYDGKIDNRFAYLDVEDDRLEGEYRIWLFGIPKLYSLVTDRYLHLTSEVGWYPRSGLPAGSVFPSPTRHDYTSYKLSVTVPRDMTAISQGKTQIDSTGQDHLYTFEPDKPLPQISLTVGKYEKQQIKVDSVTYVFQSFPGHDYYAPYLDSVADTLPNIIRELKNEYEVLLGMEYPHDRLILAETPIQFYSYRRLWTLAQETVQPQIIFLPETGTICAGSDFSQMKRIARRRQERANQEESPAVIQAGYFANFVKVDLLGMQSGSRFVRRNESIEPRYDLLANYVSYSTYLSSKRWPVLNHAFESYFYNRLAPPQDTRWRTWRGLTDQEKANLAMREFSLADLVEGVDMEPVIRSTALKSKGEYLLSLLEVIIGPDQFNKEVNQFLTDNRSREITDGDLIDFVGRLSDINLTTMVDTWYSDTTIPGYVVDELESYQVMDGERIRNQVKMKISNPTPIDGIVRLDLRYRRRESDYNPWWMRGQQQSDFRRTIMIPAMTNKEIGFLIDQPPAEMMLETYVAQNIPSVIRVPFIQQKLRKNEMPFEDEISEPITDSIPETIDEFLVDNEDDGFNAMTSFRENWLRRTLLAVFGTDDETDPYVGLRSWDPPGYWVATTNQSFHGKFIHSGHYKESGDGENKVAWTVELDETDDYEIYYHYEGSDNLRTRRRHRHEQQNLGEREFLIHHEDGTEILPFDLDIAEEGWNYLGTFRLHAGLNIVELSDRSETAFVTADAVKWVRR